VLFEDGDVGSFGGLVRALLVFGNGSEESLNLCDSGCGCVVDGRAKD